MQTQSQKSKRSPQKTAKKAAAKAAPDMRQSFEALLEWYSEAESVTAEDVSVHYSKDVFFKDPFREIESSDELAEYLAKMYDKMTNVRYVFDNRAMEGSQAFVTWVMTATVLSQEIAVRGVSHLKFDPASGLCEYHRDYFDTSEEIYEQVPVVGNIIKGIKSLFN